MQRPREPHSSRQQISPPNNNDTILLTRELTAAQARISQLDADLVDKNTRIKILNARVKSLEEKSNEQIYNRYFPGPSHHGDTSSTNDHHCSRESESNMHSANMRGHCAPCRPAHNTCHNCFRSCSQMSHDQSVLAVIKDIRSQLNCLTGLMFDIMKCRDSEKNDNYPQPQSPILARDNCTAEKELLLPTSLPSSPQNVQDMTVSSHESSILGDVSLNLN